MHGNVLFAICLFECNINSDIFYSWVTPALIPGLPKKSVTVMDNASFYIRNDIQKAIIDAGHQLEYLPIYSPDLNPIEHKWSQAKRKKVETGCDIDSLFSANMM